MDKLKKEKTIFLIKIAVLCVLGAAELFLTYSVIGYLVVWFSQPRFVAVSGGVTTASLGFLIQFIIFTIFFLLVAAAIVVCSIFFFKKKSQRNSKKI